MYKKDVRLLGKAIVEGISIKFEQELANSTESVLCSEEHKAAMLEIIEIGQAIERRMGKKRLIAILVAAALLAVVSAAVYFGFRFNKQDTGCNADELASIADEE